MGGCFEYFSFLSVVFFCERYVTYFRNDFPLRQRKIGENTLGLQIVLVINARHA